MDSKEFKEIQDRQRALCIEKNKAYGEKNISVFGLDGVIVRINDKVNRLTQLAYNKKVDKSTGNLDETVCDTLSDISNYATIGMMLIEGKWENESKDKDEGGM